MTSQLFYAGGHRFTFDGLHFACAFTGGAVQVEFSLPVA
jgi:hypothetical protein